MNDPNLKVSSARTSTCKFSFITGFLTFISLSLVFVGPRGQSGITVGYMKNIDPRYSKNFILKLLEESGCKVRDVKRCFHRGTGKPMPVVKIFHNSYEDLTYTINTDFAVKFNGNFCFCFCHLLASFNLLKIMLGRGCAIARNKFHQSGSIQIQLSLSRCVEG